MIDNSLRTRRSIGLLLGGVLVAAALSACSPYFAQRQSISLAETDIRRVTVWQATLPPDMQNERLRAEDQRDVAATARIGVDAAAEAGFGAAADRRALADPIDAAFASLLVDTAAGRSFLRAPIDGRALAYGAPAAACPSIGLATGQRSLGAAGETALSACLDHLARMERFTPDGQQTPDCGCRLIAIGDVLLADREDFAHARAVSALAIDLESGVRTPLVTTLRGVAPDLADSAASDVALLDAERAGAAEIGLATARGDAARLTIDAAGGARLDNLATGAVYEGVWRAEGFRRGHIAGAAAVTREDGSVLVILIGYEPAEITRRGDRLIAAATALAAAAPE